MRVLIIEDEKPAAEKLQLLLGRLDSAIEVLDVIDNVGEAVSWLEKHSGEVDLLFMDIQLLDGKSFEIFDEIEISKPIIFTTAFQEYSLEAFKVNAVDYLLKPITLKALRESLEKFEKLKTEFSSDSAKTGHLAPEPENAYKSRFMVKFGDHIRSVPVEAIAYFFAEGRNVYLYTNENDKYIIDFTLEELDQSLNPGHFYRVNRSFIIALSAVREVLVYSNSRLKILCHIEPIKEIIVAREKVGPFKDWFSGS